MKKTLLALAGAALLLALVLLLQNRRDAARRAEHFAFDTAQGASVEYLRVALQADTAVLEKSGGLWVTPPDGFPADTAKVRKALGYLLGLQTRELVSTNPSRLAEYGLDSTQAKHVEWRGAKGETRRVVIGKTSGVDYSSTYWKWEDKPDVYSTPGNFTWDISPRPVDWKERGLFAAAARDIRTLEVDWRDSADQPHHYKLESVDDSTVKMMEPDSAPVRKSEASNLLAQAGQFSIDDFVAPGDTDLAHARLDTPMVVVKIGLKNGKSHVLEGGRTFLGFVYVRHPSRDEVVKVSSWRFDAFRKKPSELIAADTAKAGN